MEFLKRFGGGLLAALVLGLPLPALAEPSGQDHLEMDSVGRTRDYVIPVYVQAAIGTQVTNGCDAQDNPASGLECGLLVLNDNGFKNSNGTTTLTSTATYVYPLPYPTRVGVGILDLGSAGTPSCTTLVIRGKDWRGFSRKETFSTINETEQFTTYGYESVTSWTLSGCSGADADDDFYIRASKYITMPVQIRKDTQIVSACAVDFAGSSGVDTATISLDAPNCVPGSALTYTAASNSIDASALVDEEEKSMLIFRVRAGG
jgi:hypothetical protein